MINDQEGKETMIHNTFSRGKKLIPCIAAAGMLCLQVLVLPAAAEPEDQRFSAFFRRSEMEHRGGCRLRFFFCLLPVF